MMITLMVGGVSCKAEVWRDPTTRAVCGTLCTSDYSLVEMCLFFHRIPTNHGDCSFVSMEKSASSGYELLFTMINPNMEILKAVEERKA